MEAASGNSGRDVHNRSVLVSVLGVPSTSYEIDLVHDGRLEQLVEAAGNSCGHRHSVDVIGVLGVLAANVNLACRSASGASDRLLQNLRRRGRRRAVILVLLEALVASSRIDC